MKTKLVAGDPNAHLFATPHGELVMYDGSRVGPPHSIERFVVLYAMAGKDPAQIPGAKLWQYTGAVPSCTSVAAIAQTVHEHPRDGVYIECEDPRGDAAKSVWCRVMLAKDGAK